MTRTDRRPRKRLDAAQRQAEIIAAAREAFAAQPYEQVSMAGIARRAESSEALLYRYHSSKAALYTAVVRELGAEALARQRAAAAALPAGTGVRERVAAALDAYLDLLAESDTGLLLPGNDPAEALAAREELNAEYVAWLAELTGAGASDEYILHGHAGFLTAVARVWAERDCPAADRPRLRQVTLDALFSSLFVPETTRAGQRRSKFGRG